ncbi:LysR substrate-binding domain-containing protein [Amycolatopsis sp. 195334CR]|uniref:LysR family transcriptional regulator n=1 Tax=Amycolatopsis sp. 195334CR TaxID=2814588 RepID=UPI001A8D6698|nr:LysR substrate-binding domain-containing protein [Amycolatopsis sp. 195334CR]MBN6038416.1 LysR family transcriptional regulator [Amycolatopsis sp. 195334CR]
MDLYKLNHLVAVAEEGSFTRAAARLHLSQQALSTSVRTLEREIGVPLLDRGATGVTVLPAGQALIDDARVLHGVAGAAVRRARRIGRGEPERLRIGHTPAVTGDEVISLLRVVPDELVTDVNQRYPGELTDQLLDGELDLGLGRALTPAHGLVRTTLTRQRLRVAVAAGHPLAGREEVRFTDLAGEEITVWGSPGRSGYTDLLLNLCRDAGFEPRVRRNPIQGTPPVTAVVGTGSVAFVTADPGPAAGNAVRVLELTPPAHVPLHALWPQHSTSDARDAFLSAFA